MQIAIEQKIHEFAEQMYNAGYNTGYKDKCLLTDEECLADQKHQYEKGLNDAWECAKKIVLERRDDYTVADTISIFRCNKLDVLLHFSASEAIAKIKEYEEKQKQTDDEIKVGDGVVSVFGKHGYVTGIDKDELYVLYPNGEVGHFSANIYAKDGRHFPQIAEVLKQMKEEE